VLRAGSVRGERGKKRGKEKDTAQGFRREFHSEKEEERKNFNDAQPPHTNFTHSVQGSATKMSQLFVNGSSVEGSLRTPGSQSLG